ncbi:MAG: hypothetical protein J6X53_05085, partial [Abditibacteriota bacterium]|nr:hypothetical protein [Abditibacteriota bacterium]
YWNCMFNNAFKRRNLRDSYFNHSIEQELRDINRKEYDLIMKHCQRSKDYDSYIGVTLFKGTYVSLHTQLNVLESEGYHLDKNKKYDVVCSIKDDDNISDGKVEVATECPLTLKTYDGDYVNDNLATVMRFELVGDNWLLSEWTVFPSETF